MIMEVEEPFFISSLANLTTLRLAAARISSALRSAATQSFDA